MFNEVSKQKSNENNQNTFPYLFQYTKLLLNDPTECWFLLPNGSWNFFDQEEGLPRGCPFSPVFAALVLRTIIESIDKLLRKGANKRNKNGIPGGELGIAFPDNAFPAVFLKHKPVFKMFSIF